MRNTCIIYNNINSWNIIYYFFYIGIGSNIAFLKYCIAPEFFDILNGGRCSCLIKVKV